MDLRGLECGGMDWIDLSQDRDQWMANLNTVMKISSFIDWPLFLRKILFSWSQSIDVVPISKLISFLFQIVLKYVDIL
jgi:hypothetical protein